jgi:mannose-6-phosphate isomerase-like protein (cupin superfamily)
MDGSYSSVAQAIAAHLAGMPRSTDDLGVAVLHLRQAAEVAVPRPDLEVSPGSDYTATLAPAIAAGRNHDVASVAEAMAALLGPLPWRYSYPPRPASLIHPVDLGERIAFAELIGPRAPLSAPGCRAGFTLMAPDTFYPLHAHPAIELYLVIAGHAQWTTPEAERIVPPGEFVLHRSSQAHAMRTFAEPLLALYGWSGDIDTPASYI